MHDLPPLPPGFKRTKDGQRFRDPESLWLVQFRSGVVARQSVKAGWMQWKWYGGGGDVVAVRKAD